MLSDDGDDDEVTVLGMMLQWHERCKCTELLLEPPPQGQRASASPASPFAGHTHACLLLVDLQSSVPLLLADFCSLSLLSPQAWHDLAQRWGIMCK